MDEQQDDGVEETRGVSRRDALKKGAIAAGAAGVVWAAPVVEGLSVRPDYAAAATGGPGTGFTFNVPLPNLPVFGAFDFIAPLGGFGNITTTWTQDQVAGTSSTTKAVANAIPPTCGFTGVTFDGRIGFEANPNLPNNTVVTATTLTAQWLGFFDTFDDEYGGTAHVTVSCI